MSSKDFAERHNGQVHRRMTKCKLCGSWWSQLDPSESEVDVQIACPCGGDLEPVDMKAHIAGLPDGAGSPK